MPNPQIDTNTIKAIESVLAKGDRAEVAPVNDVVNVKEGMIFTSEIQK